MTSHWFNQIIPTLHVHMIYFWWSFYDKIEFSEITGYVTDQMYSFWVRDLFWERMNAHIRFYRLISFLLVFITFYAITYQFITSFLTSIHIKSAWIVVLLNAFISYKYYRKISVTSLNIKCNQILLYSKYYSVKLLNIGKILRLKQKSSH
jgi:hypothetical protein